MLSFHGHNDFGLALANSLAAVEGGALQVEGTLTGIGTRAGNLCLEEMLEVARIMWPERSAGKVRSKHAGQESSSREKLWKAAKVVEEITGIKIVNTKPIVGANARSGFRQLDT